MENPASQDEADKTLASQFQFVLEGRRPYVGHTITESRQMLPNLGCACTTLTNAGQFFACFVI